MTFDLTMKAVMAIVGLIGGIAQACVNGKTLINMAKQSKTEENSSENTESQQEEV